MAQRIDSLTPGQRVELKFHGSARLGNDENIQVNEFIEIQGTGDNREAIFEAIDGGYTWAAYRFRGGWVYGTSAERLSLVRVIESAEA